MGGVAASDSLRVERLVFGDSTCPTGCHGTSLDSSFIYLERKKSSPAASRRTQLDDYCTTATPSEEGLRGRLHPRPLPLLRVVQCDAFLHKNYT